MLSDTEKSEMEKAELKKELVLGDLVFQLGSEIDVIRVTSRVYKVFVSTGWWAVSADYFLKERQSVENVDDLMSGDTLRAMGMM